MSYTVEGSPGNVLDQLRTSILNGTAATLPMRREGIDRPWRKLRGVAFRVDQIQRRRDGSLIFHGRAVTDGVSHVRIDFTAAHAEESPGSGVEGAEVVFAPLLLASLLEDVTAD